MQARILPGVQAGEGEGGLRTWLHVRRQQLSQLQRPPEVDSDCTAQAASVEAVTPLMMRRSDKRQTTRSTL